MRFREKASSCSATLAVLPRIVCATRLSLRGLTLRPCRYALASVSASWRGVAGLPMALFPFLLDLAVGRVAVEEARRRELAELVADHVLGHQNGDELVPVVDAEGEADELRKNRRPSGPGLDDLVAPGATRLLRLLEQMAVDER